MENKMESYEEIIKKCLPADLGLIVSEEKIIKDDHIIAVFRQSKADAERSYYRMRRSSKIFLFAPDDDNQLIIMRSMDNKLVQIEIAEFVNEIRTLSKVEIVTGAEREQMLQTFISLVENAHLDSRQKQYLKLCAAKKAKIEKAWGSYQFSNDNEQRLFLALLNQPKKEIKTVCRYCSLASCFKLIDEDSVAMMSLTCMNDSSESDYVDRYRRSRGTLHDLKQSLEDNSHFIMSCSEIEMEDKLFMWTMYGDRAKGVCLQLNVPDKFSDKYKWARVSYAREDGTHPELDFINSLIENDFMRFNNIQTWKHFFKAYEYAGEKEVRLLTKQSIKGSSEIKWVLTSNDIVAPLLIVSKSSDNFPLKLSRVIIGPLCPNRNTNLQQLRALIKVKGKAYKDCIVLPSAISSLR